jgi:XTP/dITP diphosphohydrolase
MSQLILATNNLHKVAEIKALLAGHGIEILSAVDFPDFPRVEETGETLAENALLKARAIWRKYRLPALADDTGLEVKYLRGAPGVYSARFAGPDSTYADNNRRLLTLLKEVPDEARAANFRTVIAFIDMSEKEYLVEGTLNGNIGHDPRGEYGFGYDPIFVIKGSEKTLAQYPPQEKNRISHRSRALAMIRPIILGSLIERC